jgi:hypothetical protein
MEILELLYSRRYPLAKTTHNWTHCSNWPGYNISAWTTQKAPIEFTAAATCWPSRCPETAEARPHRKRPVSNSNYCVHIRCPETVVVYRGSRRNGSVRHSTLVGKKEALCFTVEGLRLFDKMARWTQGAEGVVTVLKQAQSRLNTEKTQFPHKNFVHTQVYNDAASVARMRRSSSISSPVSHW